MEFEILFQNEKFKIIEFLDNIYIDIPKEDIPYVSFNNEERFYPIRGFFSSKCDIKIIDENNIISLFFYNEILLSEVVYFTNIIGVEETTISITEDAYSYPRVNIIIEL